MQKTETGSSPSVINTPILVGVIFLLFSIIIIQLNPQLKSTIQTFIDQFDSETPITLLTTSETDLYLFDLILQTQKFDFKFKKVEGSEIENNLFGSEIIQPILKQGELVIFSREPILRYIAKKAKIQGSSIVDEATCDMISSIAFKFRESFLENKNKLEKSVYIKDYATKSLNSLDKWLLSNGGFYGGGRYFVNNQLSLADYVVFEILILHQDYEPEILSNYPMLKSFTQNFKQIPNIAKFLQSNQ
eukprot:TRINITY_DN958_c1_g1_i1.p1 TRINITY_DN958_c1_g1~~TRINITY_DN958_c1_g1_i1.p1  ORF type:complete len:246 (-),score=93.14 TRINITY_DN958_c1_g1_i1:99-836(-)